MKRFFGWLYYRRNILYVLVALVIAFLVAQKIINNNPNINKNSKFYTNSIYMSDGRIYEDYLSSKQQEFYDLFMYGINKGKSVLYVKPEEYGCKDVKDCYSYMSIASHAVMTDHPELLSFGGWMAQYKPKDKEITLRIQNSFKLPLMNQVGEMIINKKIHDIKKATKNMTEKEKIKYVYNWIGQNTTYDRLFTTDSKNQTIYNVFVNHNAVCAGFAKASQVIFQAIGIKSYTVLGNTTGLHMWNIVEVDGRNYFYDSTVAACIDESSSHYYDGLRQSNFSNYTESYNWYPKTTSRELYEDYELKD